MKSLPNNEFAQILENVSYESRHVEFKAGFKWDKEVEWMKEKMAKAVIGFSNTRYGGQIIIGVREDKNKSLIFEGVNQEQLDSFYNYDDIKSTIDSYVYTYVNFDIYQSEYKSKKYVIFKVHEFDQYPLITSRDSESRKHKGKPSRIIRKNKIYARSKTDIKISTITHLELIEIINMATDKRIDNLNSRGWYKVNKSVAEAYYDENYDVLETNKDLQALKDIRSKGYWDIQIHPNTEPNKINDLNIQDIKFMLRNSQINIDDQLFPIIAKDVMPEDVDNHEKIIEKDNSRLISWVNYSFWREFISISNKGNLLYLKGLRGDWINEQIKYVESTGQMSIYKVEEVPILYRAEIISVVTLVFLYARNLMERHLYKDPITISIALNNCKSRVLRYGAEPNSNQYISTADLIELKDTTIQETITEMELLNYSHNLIKEVLSYFGVDQPDDTYIRDKQQRILKRT